MVIPASKLLIRTAEPSDALFIQAVVQDWWGRPIESDMFSPFFLRHFRETCLVAEKDQRIAGFLIGFLSQTQKEEAYIRFVVIDPQCRNEGIGRALYENFFAVMHRQGRTTVRSVTSPTNKGSVAFHQRMGFSLEPQEHYKDGLPVCRDYHGRTGTDRILFVKALE
jgi:ribosomal protein S18 acetylase RimI-like enzyme